MAMGGHAFWVVRCTHLTDVCNEKVLILLYVNHAMTNKAFDSIQNVCLNSTWNAAKRVVEVYKLSVKRFCTSQVFYYFSIYLINFRCM